MTRMRRVTCMCSKPAHMTGKCEALSTVKGTQRFPGSMHTHEVKMYFRECMREAASLARHISNTEMGSMSNRLPQA